MGSRSGASSSNIQLQHVEFEPSTCVLETCCALAVDALPKGLSIRAEVAPDVPTVVGDPARFREVLQTVGNNAVKFTSRGGVSVRLAANPRSSRVLLRTAVSDTGVGMSCEVASRFVRPLAGERDSDATGLVKCGRLLAAMGGSMSIESEPGAGTTLTLEIPFERPASNDSAARRTSDPLRVLLAIGDLADGAAASELLAGLGIEADVVCAGLDAVDAWLLNPYDLVIMACRAPVARACGAARDIRVIERMRGGTKTPIIALVASGDSGHCRTCDEGHIDGVAITPLTRASLSGLVRQHVRRGPGRGLGVELADEAPPAVDWARLRQLAAGDASFTRRILDGFLADAERLMTAAEAAAQRHDIKALLGALDSLKGTGANVGAPALSEAAAKAEELAMIHGCEATMKELSAVRAALDDLHASCKRRS